MAARTYFGANWVTQQIDDLPFKWPILEHVYNAHIRPIHFYYPLNWYQGINVSTYGSLSAGAEYGFVSTADWQVQPDSPIGIWFFVGEVAMPVSYYADTHLISIVTKQAVTIEGLKQKVYYCETITSPAYDSTKFIANFGLLSVHTPLTVRFSVTNYLKCHPSADNWFVYDAAQFNKALLQFGGHTFGLIPSEANQAFATQAAAEQFFMTKDYLQAKKIILSTVVG